MISRRSLLLAAPAVIIAGRAFAQAPSMAYRIPDEGAPTEIIDPDRAEWFGRLKRPDVMAEIARNEASSVGVTSCCDAGDGYPIIIDEEAYPPHIGRELNGRAHVTDPSAKMLLIPDGKGGYGKKYRPKMEGPLDFKFSADKVVREIDGNPTKTAWVFCAVEYPQSEHPGYMNTVYCIVPVPPGY